MRLRLRVVPTAQRHIRAAKQWWLENRPAAPDLLSDDLAAGVVEIEYAPEGHTTWVAIEDHLLGQLARRAKATGVSVETLVNLWLQERLTA